MFAYNITYLCISVWNVAWVLTRKNEELFPIWNFKMCKGDRIKYLKLLLKLRRVFFLLSFSLFAYNKVGQILKINGKVSANNNCHHHCFRDFIIVSSFDENKTVHPWILTSSEKDSYNHQIQKACILALYVLWLASSSLIFKMLAVNHHTETILWLHNLNKGESDTWLLFRKIK